MTKNEKAEATSKTQIDQRSYRTTLDVMHGCFEDASTFGFSMAVLFTLAGGTVARRKWNNVNGSRLRFFEDGRMCREFAGLSYLSPVVYSPDREDAEARDWFVVTTNDRYDLAEHGVSYDTMISVWLETSKDMKVATTRKAWLHADVREPYIEVNDHGAVTKNYYDASYHSDEPYVATEEDRAASDWIIYGERNGWRDRAAEATSDEP